MADDGPVRLRLQDRILRARHAIRDAGFNSHKYKPKGGVLRVDVLVPVYFDDGCFFRDDLENSVRQQISDAAAPKVAPVAKRGPGRPRKT